MKYILIAVSEEHSTISADEGTLARSTADAVGDMHGVEGVKVFDTLEELHTEVCLMIDGVFE